MREPRQFGEALVTSEVNKLITEFRYPDEIGGGAVVLEGGGGAPSIVVAASDASDLSKAKADMVCLGVNDEDIIQAANGKLGIQGGRLVLTEGTFNIVVPTGSPFTAAIFLTAGVTLLGMGATWNQAATFLAQSNTGSGFGTMIRVRGGTVDNLSISVNDDANGIILDDDQCVVERVYLTNGSGHGIIIDDSSAENRIVRACHFNMATGDAIHASDTGGSTPKGIFILNNYFEYGGTRSIYLGTVDGAVIAGNISEGSDESSIYVDASADRVSVVNNVLKLAGFHGISLTGVSHSVVAGNTIYRPSQSADNTYDGIIIDGLPSFRNLVEGNKIIPPAAGNAPRYGINIATTDECNIVVSNDLGDPDDYGTDALNDNGANTQLFYPNDATYGDNFTDCGTGS